MKMVYIASPLRGDYNQNIKNAVEYCRVAANLGVLPLAPHIIFSQWCNDTIPEQREQGLKLGLKLLENCRELWVLGGQISTGMSGEIAFAKEHGIPTFYVKRPYDPDCYPVSLDEQSLLCRQDCIPGSNGQNYEKQMVILQFERLKPEYRTPRNQLWICTHGPGCRPDFVHSDTIHLRHPVDGDYMAVGRGEVLGLVKPEVFAKLQAAYPELAPASQTAGEQDEGFCL